MATIEKMQAESSPPQHQHAEARIEAAAKQLKGGNPELCVIFYLNSVMDWPQYDLHEMLATQHPEWWLKGDNGEYIYINAPGSSQKTPIHVFDLAQYGMRNAFLDVLRHAKATGNVDGCFLDRGNTNATTGAGGAHGWNMSLARKQAWDAGHAELLQAAGELFADGVVIGNNQDYLGVNGRMFESFGLDFGKNWGNLNQDISDLMSEAGTRYAEACHDDVFNISLAAFLVGAGDLAYHACNDGWVAQAGWDKWRPEYDRPLGPPTGQASKVKGSTSTVYQRSFASNTSVHLEVFDDSSNVPVACLCWGDGAITGANCHAICHTTK